MNFWTKLLSLFRRNRREAEMAEELALHCELQFERNLAAGMSPEEARRAAQRQFGHFDKIKEESRDALGLRWLHDAAQDTRYALRTLRKHRGMTTAAVVALAVGIGLNTAVFSIINTLFWQPIQGVPDPARVLFFNGEASTADRYALLEDGLRDIASLTAARSIPGIIRVGDRSFHRRAVAVSENYFAVLGVEPVRGRFFDGAAGAHASDHAAPVAVLSHVFWEKQLERDPSVIGQMIHVDRLAVTVIGVARPRFHGPGPEAPALWLPLAVAPQLQGEATVGPPTFSLLGRLRSGRTLDEARAALAVVTARSPEIFGERSRLHLSVGREDWRGEVSAEKEIEFLLVTFVPLVVVGGVLWIACSNVANLLLARAVQRRREIAIRIASGAGRGRLMRMLLLESMLLAVLGGVLGLWVSATTLDFVFATLSDFGALSIQIDERVLGYTFAVSIVSAVLFGLVPALQASRADVSSGLKTTSGGAGDRRGVRLRAWFLGSQIASTVALLIVAGTFVKSLVWTYADTARNATDRLLVARLPGGERSASERGLFYDDARERLARLPAIEAVAVIDPNGARPRKVTRHGVSAREGDPLLSVQAVTPAFFSLPQVVVLRGEAWSDVRGAAVLEVMINVALARAWWSEDTAVGQLLDIEAQPHRVVGVVADGGDRPHLFVPFQPENAAAADFLVSARGRAEDAFDMVADTLRELSSAEAGFQLQTARKLTLRGLSQITQIASLIGGLALLLAASGLYASMTFSTRQRTTEFGVRMALGATRADIVRLVLRGSTKVVGWGSGVGVLVGLAGLQVLNSMLFGGGVVDVVALLLVLIFFGAVTLFASLLPARQASRVDPLVALRAE
jgi:predicted permease